MTMLAISPKAQFAQQFIDLPDAAGVPGARWEAFQIKYLNNTSRFGIDVKARQIAWSFTAALDAVIDGVLSPNTPHIFVSINLDEAKEKIRYAKAIINAINPKMRPALIRESQTALEFENGSRLISHPCRPVRGKAQARVYLDEMAHYAESLDRAIYLAALPSTTKGGGYMRIGSSPFGARGLFWEIVDQGLKKWPGFKRMRIPWWEIHSLCEDVPNAKLEAPGYLTEVRVEEFGTPVLKEIFQNMFLEDFCHEYECMWVDETVAWISWEMIQKNQNPQHVWWHAKTLDQAYTMLDYVALAVRERLIEFVMTAGIDIGRKRDLTELMVFGKSATGLLPLRFSVSLDKVEYDDQEKFFKKVVDTLPLTKVLIDNNGIGAQLAENLHKYNRKCEEFPFTNPSKELLAVEARLQFQRGAVPIPLDRDIAYQIHSIKKTSTASKNNVYDTERNAKHHADKFWGAALGIFAAKTGLATWDDITEAQLGEIEGYVESKPWR